MLDAATCAAHFLVFDDVAVDDVELLLLPGADMWEQAAYPRERLEALITRMVELERPVAATCAATLALGRARVLDDRRHTSNASSYLRTHVPEYLIVDIAKFS